MKRYRLSRDISIQFHGYEVTAKAGDPVQPVQGGTGISFALITGRVSQDVAALYAHDSTYRYVWAPADAVEEVTDHA